MMKRPDLFKQKKDDIVTPTGRILQVMDGGNVPYRPAKMIKNEMVSKSTIPSILIAGGDSLPTEEIPHYMHKESGERSMDEGTKMMLERLERDSREREQRYHADAQEREKRYRDESKEIEERIAKLIGDLRDDVKSEFKAFEAKLDKIDQSVDAKLDKIETRVDNTYKHITAITISTIVGIGACVLAVAAVGITVWLSNS
jgi:hypothetical protein